METRLIKHIIGDEKVSTIDVIASVIEPEEIRKMREERAKDPTATVPVITPNVLITKWKIRQSMPSEGDFHESLGDE